MPKGRFVDLSGQRFGRWKVVCRDVARKTAAHSVFWICSCDCGGVGSVRTDSILRGKSVSCGCFGVEVRRSSHHRLHGMSPKVGRPAPSEYSTWVAMKQRCYNPKSVGYNTYGGRGITVCERWRHSFTAFLEDMGRKPNVTYSLDRINPNGHYEFANCRWASRETQARNVIHKNLISFEGASLTVAAWSRKVGVCPATLKRRLREWGIQRALTTARKIPKHGSSCLSKQQLLLPF